MLFEMSCTWYLLHQLILHWRALSVRFEGYQPVSAEHYYDTEQVRLDGSSRKFSVVADITWENLDRFIIRCTTRNAWLIKFQSFTQFTLTGGFWRSICFKDFDPQNISLRRIKGEGRPKLWQSMTRQFFFISMSFLGDKFRPIVRLPKQLCLYLDDTRNFGHMRSAWDIQWVMGDKVMPGPQLCPEYKGQMASYLHGDTRWRKFLSPASSRQMVEDFQWIFDHFSDDCLRKS